MAIVQLAEQLSLGPGGERIEQMLLVKRSERAFDDCDPVWAQ
jgi:hypothetical protein